MKIRLSSEEEKRRVLADPARLFWAHIQKTAECWQWTAYTSAAGYGKSGRRQYAHRLSWEIHNGPIPAELSVLHRCDNPPCVRPDHLFLGTDQDNMQDMVGKGRHWSRARPWRIRRGERVNTTRLTASQVVEIRRKYDAGTHTQRDLAREYGITQYPIWRIVSGTGWKHLPKEAP